MKNAIMAIIPGLTGTSPVKSGKTESKLIADYILQKSGLDFRGKNITHFNYSLKERMLGRNLDSYIDYFNLLKNNPGEYQEFLNLLATGETFFFRNIPQFELLREKILPEIINQKRIEGSRDLKIFSAGCSTGEEPYSIAMTVLSVVNPKEFNIRILAGDINRNAVSHALRGNYSKRALRLLTKEQVQEFFTANPGETYTIFDRIKNMVSFQCMNLIELDDFLHERDVFDIIFCRNVIIYFDRGNTVKLLAVLKRHLSDKGCIFMGHSEILFGVYDGLLAQNRGKTTVYRKKGISRSQLPVVGSQKSGTPISRRDGLSIQGKRENRKAKQRTTDNGQRTNLQSVYPEPSQSAIRNPKPRISHYQRAIDFASRKDMSAAEKEFLAELKAHPHNSEAHLELAQLFADTGHYDTAIEHCRKVIGSKRLSGRGYFLLGQLYERKGSYVDAVDAYRKAIYADFNNYMAHFNLAGIYRSQYKKHDELRELETTVRCIELKKELNETYFDPTKSGNYVRNLCLKMMEEGRENGRIEYSDQSQKLSNSKRCKYG